MAWCKYHQCKFDPAQRPNPHYVCETALVDDVERGQARSITADDAAEEAGRYSTGVRALDRVLGGGAVKGAVILLTGDPGCGKSTLLLHVAYCMALAGATVLYISGEETRAQITARAVAMGALHPNLILQADSDGEVGFREVARCRPHVVFVDSVQRLAMSYSRQPNGRVRPLHAPMGSEAQVRAVMNAAIHVAKRTDDEPVVFVIGHVIKDGSAAGPKAIEHDADVRLHFSIDPANTRTLRSGKNRHGPTGETAVFEFKGPRLVELSPGAASLLRRSSSPGALTFPATHLPRPYLVSVEAAVLAGKPKTVGKVRATGVPESKVREILELLSESDVGLPIERTIRLKVQRAMERDVTDPAIDLALAAAILSGDEHAVIERCAVFGELSPAGTVRGDGQWERRLSALREGSFIEVVGPPMRELPEGIAYRAVANLQELRDWVRQRARDGLTPPQNLPASGFIPPVLVDSPEAAGGASEAPRH